MRWRKEPGQNLLLTDYLRQFTLDDASADMFRGIGFLTFTFYSWFVIGRARGATLTAEEFWVFELLGGTAICSLGTACDHLAARIKPEERNHAIKLFGYILPSMLLILLAVALLNRGFDGYVAPAVPLRIAANLRSTIGLIGLVTWGAIWVGLWYVPQVFEKLLELASLRASLSWSYSADSIELLKACPKCGTSVALNDAACAVCDKPNLKLSCVDESRETSGLGTVEVPITPTVAVVLDRKASRNTLYVFLALGFWAAVSWLMITWSIVSLPAVFWFVSVLGTFAGAVSISSLFLVYDLHIRMDLTRSAYNRVTGPARFWEQENYGGPSRFHLKVNGCSFDLSGAGFRYLALLDGHVLTVGHTRHSEILLEILDAGGRAVYQDRDFPLREGISLQ